ncbi:MAG: cytochrome b/b6 domain-containing protein [Rhodospirillales bacterium]|nr:cytochrome b/b6 domain-containing protein [Rhodospirillales bacterium]
MPKPARSKPAQPDAHRWVRVWDPVVRIFHWGLVCAFVTAWFSAARLETIHHLAGYAALGLIAIRLVWGVIGTRHARFSQFVRHPMTVLAYLRAIATGSEARHLGHNPAGGAMIVALILAVSGTAITGWMMTTNRYWGVAWVNQLHSLLAHGVLVLVGFHLAGVLLASLRHRENLVWSMISGRKRVAGAEEAAE